ncbi:MAG: DUF4112 domain-containing protein [Candidatus Gracilibacteria bacterium]
MEINDSTIDKPRSDKEQILQNLKKAKNSEERVKIFADVMDNKGIDVLLGLIPGLGDGAVAALATAYLLTEAKIAKVSSKNMWKITKHQAVDFGLGAVPFLGDIADFFNKSHQKSLEYFSLKTEELVEQAKMHGATEEEIANILSGAEKVHTVLKKGVANKQIQSVTKNVLQKFSNVIQKKK